MEQRTKKPTLSLRKKTDAPTPIVEPTLPHEYPDFTQSHFPEWDIPEISDVEPKRRKRRKDRHVEQYRKEARWQ
jgi:hypothetical protein